MPKFRNIEGEYNLRCDNFNTCEVYDKLDPTEQDECHSDPSGCPLVRYEKLQEMVLGKGKTKPTPTQEVAKVTLKDLIDAAETRFGKAHVLGNYLQIGG